MTNRTELAILKADNDRLRAGLEAFRSIVMKEHLETCVHHTNRERNDAGCPVCAKAEIERIRAAFGPTIAVMEDWIKYMKPYTGFINNVSRTKVELARLRAIVEKGTE